jgi:Tfp pilus assembly protein PilV
VKRPPRDEGETLLEVVISIAIMGIAFVGLLGAMLTAASMSGLHRRQADAQVLLVSAVEQLKSASYVSCADSTSYSPPAGVTETVEYWNGIDFGPTCFEVDASVPPEQQVPFYATQRITVVVSGGEPQASLTETILKRR